MMTTMAARPMAILASMLSPVVVMVVGGAAAPRMQD
jgi:hypothetical protein